VRRRRYRLSLHAERERDADCIEVSELEEALLSEHLELIEDYPEDPRGHSRLLLGFTRTATPIHAVCSEHEAVLVIITVYRPDPKLWQDYRVRKEKT
jgi:hypothetical protein